MLNSLYVGQVFYRNGDKLEIVRMDYFGEIIICRSLETYMKLFDLNREEVLKCVIAEAKGV